MSGCVDQLCVWLQEGLRTCLISSQLAQPPPTPRPGTRGLSPPLADTESGLWVSPLFSVVMTVASSGSPQPCLVLADSRKTYADSGASSVAVNCLTVAPTSTVVKVLGLLLARR